MLAEYLPPFDSAVPQDGYHWWYVDGLSDDGTQGIVVIAFIGSVFSPYYFRARQHGQGTPQNYCAINVVHYSPTGKHWAMTERSAGQLTQRRDFLRISDSALEVRGNTLQIDVDERTVPWPRRLRGNISVQARQLNRRQYALDAAGRHQWHPVAPDARLSVDFADPDIRWSGKAYIDSNYGVRPLESDFRSWDWSRFIDEQGTTISYNVVERNNDRRSLCLRTTSRGIASEPVPPVIRIGRSRWGLGIATKSERAVTLGRILEDTPFYTRSLVRVGSNGDYASGMHESLSLERFERPWVRALLPFRMPRIAR